MATVVAALALNVYMLISPAHWLKKLMQLTHMSLSFKGILMALGVAYFVLAWGSETYVLPSAAKLVGRVRLVLTQKPKKRKEYKVISENMRG